MNSIEGIVEDSFEDQKTRIRGKHRNSIEGIVEDSFEDLIKKDQR